ncbi:MAG: ARMT1-like domain-containing protein [Verrucomicrobiota bacterium]
MKSKDRDPNTHYELVDRGLELANFAPNVHKAVRSDLHRYLDKRLADIDGVTEGIADFHTELWREFYRISGRRDPFREAKLGSHQFAEKIRNELGDLSLEVALRYSIIANKLDFGAYDYNPEAMPVSLDFFQNPIELLYDDSQQLLDRLTLANTLLYLPDNHGEAVFDLEFIRQLSKQFPDCQICIAAKSAPMLNDVTAKDLVEIGFTEFAEVISTGTNALGAPLDEVSQEFTDAFAAADVIIAKGQAHFEFWTEFSSSKIFNLLHVKIPVVDEHFGQLSPGENLVMASERYSEGKKAYCA